MRIVSDKSMFIYSGLVLVLTFILFKDTTLSGQEKFLLGILLYAIPFSAYMLFTQSDNSYTYMMPSLLQHFFRISSFLMGFTLGPMIIYEVLCKRNDYCANLPEYIHNSFLTSKIETEHFVMFFVVVIILSVLARFIESRLEKKDLRSGKKKEGKRIFINKIPKVPRT
jgi:hypothetical protein